MNMSRGERLVAMCCLNNKTPQKKTIPLNNNFNFDIMNMPIEILENDFQEDKTNNVNNTDGIVLSTDMLEIDCDSNKIVTLSNLSNKNNFVPDAFTVNCDNYTNNNNSLENIMNPDSQDLQVTNDIQVSSEFVPEEAEDDVDYQPEEKSDDDTSSEQYENTGEETLKTERKTCKRVNLKLLNQKLRQAGKSYLGYRKPAKQSKTFHDTQRKERNLGPPCKSKFCIKSSKRGCNKISEDVRKCIFKKFWDDMSWGERKIYITNLVTATPPKENKSTSENSRRSLTLKYHLKNGNETIPVCKKMFISTLGIKERSILTWVSNSTHGISNKNTSFSSRQNKSSGFSFLKLFLESLNKLPSHYCRKETQKLYLEQHFTSLTELYTAYKDKCAESNEEPLSKTTLLKLLNKLNISLYQPKKDRCDLCIQYELKNENEEVWLIHRNDKDRARAEKTKDKEASENGLYHTLTMDLQAVKVCPSINASSTYYKTKLCVHNFTIFNLANKHCTCYWFNETEADLQASTFATCLTDYIRRHLNDSKPIVIYSDGCTYQNKNSVMANALLSLSNELQVKIEQKYLVKGHTQMECDSVHAVIERKIKNKLIHLPSDYSKLCKESRKILPYETLTLDHTFFKDFKKNMKYPSIRPGRKTGDLTVNAIRALQYLPEGIIKYKTHFDSDFLDLPVRSKALKHTIFPPLHGDRLPIKKTKFDHLQQLKDVIPNDCWSFYDNLMYVNNN